MDIFDRNFKEMLSSQTISIAGGIFTGVLLAFYIDKLFLLPGIFIFLPGFFEMRGNISGSFSSRLSSGLFLGVIKPERMNTKIIRGNLAASFLLVVPVCMILGLIAFLLNYLLLGIFSFQIIVLALVAGVIANVIEIPLTLFATFYLFRKGHDPNNIMGPFITSTGDITSVVSLLIALVIV